jgi:hypothetical protein
VAVSTIHSAPIILNASAITICSLQLKILAGLLLEISEHPDAQRISRPLITVAGNITEVALELNEIDGEADLDAISPDLQRIRHDAFFNDQQAN